jgi:signal peptidase I
MTMDELERASSGSRRVAGTLTLIAAIALALGWIAFLRPSSLGGSTTYVIVSGDSMEPGMQSGDFVIARPQDTYDVGDVVVYAVPEGDVGEGSLIIHRVIGGNADDGYVVQGDNPEIKLPDLWRPSAAEVKGKLILRIPNLGAWLPFVRSPLVLAVFAGALTTWVILGWTYDASQRVEAEATS